MIKVRCVKCDCELLTPGGILFSPPRVEVTVIKMHLCVECYAEVFDFIHEPNEELKSEMKGKGV